MANNKVASLMGRVKWSEFSSNLVSSGRVRLADYADQYGVSIPTMRKMVEQKYGKTVIFRRGRTGGVFPTPEFSKSVVSTPVGSVTYVPDPKIAVDAATERIVDNILGAAAA